MKVTIVGLISLLFLCSFVTQGLSADPTIVGSVKIEGADGVFVSGSNVYVACNDGVKIVDVSNPRTPTIVMHIDDVYVADLYVSGNYAYTVSMWDQRMYISEISNPQDPVLLGSVTFDQEPQSVYVSGSYAYVVTAHHEGNGLFVIDITNPRSPAKVGSMICDFSHPLSCCTPVDIYISGLYAYLADSGIVVVDISDPIKPVVVGSVRKDGTNNPGSDDLWPNGVYVSGSIAYVTDGDSLRILDISDLNNPIPLGSVAISSTWGCNQVQVSGSYAYVTNHEGLFAVDISMISDSSPTVVVPSVGISLNQSQFETGDTMTVTLTTTPGTGNDQWNIYVGLVPPDNTLYFMTYEPSLSFSNAWVPACPPGPITAKTATILNLILPTGLPTGEWAWASVLAKPDFSEFSELSWVPFAITVPATQTGSGSVTGTWTGTWLSSSHGVSGTFSANIIEQNSILSGTIKVPFVGLDNATLTGSISENYITFGDITGIITFTGNVNGNDSSGTYVYPQLSDTGTWLATKSQ